MGLKWGDMCKSSNALGFTISEDVRNHSSEAVPQPLLSYDIREDLLESDEDFYEDIDGNDFQAISIHPFYAPSRQTSSSVYFKHSVVEDGDCEIHFPSYDGVECSYKVECVDLSAETIPVAMRPASPDLKERPVDDSALRAQPSRHVDYLSHEWSEDDVCASWKHVVSKRGAYDNSARLENASWRNWGKKKSNLRIVPPETVKWLVLCVNVGLYVKTDMT